MLRHGAMPSLAGFLVTLGAMASILVDMPLICYLLPGNSRIIRYQLLQLTFARVNTRVFLFSARRRSSLTRGLIRGSFCRINYPGRTSLRVLFLDLDILLFGNIDQLLNSTLLLSQSFSCQRR
jgi:hypothetical protein